MIPSLLGLSEERLRKIPILGKLVDERFLSQRQRAAGKLGLGCRHFDHAFRITG